MWRMVHDRGIYIATNKPEQAPYHHIDQWTSVISRCGCGYVCAYMVGMRPRPEGQLSKAAGKCPERNLDPVFVAAVLISNCLGLEMLCHRRADKERPMMHNFWPKPRQLRHGFDSLWGRLVGLLYTHRIVKRSTSSPLLIVAWLECLAGTWQPIAGS